jgi:hypothetical protein
MGLAFLTGIAGFHAQIIDNLVGREVETSGKLQQCSDPGAESAQRQRCARSSK